MRGSNASQKMSAAKRDRRRYRLEDENVDEKYVVVVRKIDKVALWCIWHIITMISSRPPYYFILFIYLFIYFLLILFYFLPQVVKIPGVKN